MKLKKILPVLAALASALCISSAAVSFSDVDEGYWAYEQIMEYAEKGIVSGDPEGTFRPDDTVTREEFCKIMLNSFGIEVSDNESESFSDVDTDSWSYAFVEGAKDYLPGYSDGTYLPENAARRDDVTAAIVKLMGYPVAITDGNAVSSFSDGASVAPELMSYVSIAVEKGLVNGFPNGSFKPEAGITRAEALTLISRAVKTYNEKSLTWEDAVKYIDAFYPKEEADMQTVMTVNGYDVSLSEYRYYYLTYCDTLESYFGKDWRSDSDLIALFEEFVSLDTKISGTLYGEMKKNNIKISLADINELVFSQYNLLYDMYGEDTYSYLDTLNATPNYMLVNCLVSAFADELQNYLYFEELSKVFKDEYVRAKHVLVVFDGKESKEAAYAIAQNVYNKAIAGENFDTLIKQYNEDPGMEVNPDGYIFTYGQMVEPFEKATYALKEGEISEIVETVYGYHIIMRLPLDDETIAASDAYRTVAGSEFQNVIYEKVEEAQVSNSENYEQLVITVFEEAGHIDALQPDNNGEAIDVTSASSAEIIDAINEIEAPEFMYGTIPVDINDADALKAFTGLDSADGIKEVAACESMLGSQAYSLVVVKLENADNAKAVAEAMKNGIDKKKWICVQADTIKVSAKGNTVMLIMIDSEFAESITVEGVTEAFKNVCGGSLDFEI